MKFSPLHFFFIVSIICIFSFSAKAQWQLDVESGAVWNGYNDVRVPNDATLFSLSENDPGANPFFRVELLYTIKNRHTIRALYAPLQISSIGSFGSEVTFNETTFDAGTLYQATYVFNSYRLTYRYNFLTKGKFRWGLGITGKIRDAKIEVIGDNKRARTTDLGFVPLINFYAEWFPAEKLSVLLVGDALAVPGSPGRAEDVLLALRFHIDDHISFKAGYRILEGGADVDQVYNFSLFHYAVAGVFVNF